MDTRVLLIRPGATDWYEQAVLVGELDRPLSPEGLEQVQATAALIAEVPINELIASPLRRAVQTGEALERACGVSLARDHRLTALAWGSWAGRHPDDLLDEPLFQQFLARPTDVRLPGGEGLESARRRAVGAIEQAIGDANNGDVLALITHGNVIRMLLTHYMGAPVASYRRLHVSPASISVLAFGENGRARITAINWHAHLAGVLGLS